VRPAEPEPRIVTFFLIGIEFSRISDI